MSWIDFLLFSCVSHPYVEVGVWLWELMLWKVSWCLMNCVKVHTCWERYEWWIKQNGNDELMMNWMRYKWWIYDGFN